VFDQESSFSREKMIKAAQDYKKKPNQPHFDHNKLFGYEEDIDWSQHDGKDVYSHAEQIMNWGRTIEFFMVTNESFFAKICDHFADLLTKEKSGKPRDMFEDQSYFFERCTIWQLDKFKNLMRDRGHDLSERIDFVKAYFSKTFSYELSQEMQESLSIEEKYENLEKLYNYAKTKNLPKSLVQNLQHEILTTSIKLDKYDVELFKLYIQDPLEPIENWLKSKKTQEKNVMNRKNFDSWQGCL